MPTLEIQAEPDPFDIDTIRRALRQSSEDAAGLPQNPRPLSIVLRDQQGVAGGAVGLSFWGWLFVDMLWVRADLRGQGWGSRLLAAAEDQARLHGALGVWLDTFSFQARPFYEQRGYSVFGQLDDHPPGAIRYFLKKRF